jgi:hypothetical protein
VSPYFPAVVSLVQFENCQSFFQISDIDGQKYSHAYGWKKAPSVTWYHLAYVYENTDLRIYVNGELSSDGIVYGWPISSSSVNTTRMHNFLGKSWFDYPVGHFELDEVKVYNKALSQDQVQRDMIAASGITPGIC